MGRLALTFNNRDERKGLLTIGASFVAMYPFQVISACLGDQEDTYPSGEGAPGLAEQYAEQRKRIEDGAACFEIVPEPGFIGGPSELTQHIPMCRHSYLSA